jgi:hypothetical protein
LKRRKESEKREGEERRRGKEKDIPDECSQ